MTNQTTRMKHLVSILNEAAKAYYQENREIMSNFEYDKLYDELVELEKETGITLSGSPTVRVGFELLTELPKERHESPMLSLDKTKDRDALAAWLGDKDGLLSWKLDGLTIVLTYRDGKLYKAVTRGNGEIGEVITNNAKVFSNIPLAISYTGELILRGEAVIGYDEFERINAGIEDVEAKYKNPRNLCSGTVRQLNNQITAERKVSFFAFSLVKADGVDFGNSREQQILWLKSQGFETVEYSRVNSGNIHRAIKQFADKIAANNFPSDGLVLLFDDIEYGRSLGRTAKFPRDSIAFKWADELATTHLRYIEWSPSRTGLINPVAVFEPVELEGTTVSRASVHNVSILESLELGEGDEISVYKANMIIPQIAENLTRSGCVPIPKVCPVCGGATEVRQMIDVRSLYCTNPDCQAKQIKRFALFVSRDALNIDGMSEATLEKFISEGFIKEFSDLFHLERYEEQIVTLEGFGQKSYDNLVAAAKIASHTTLPRLIYGLGIPGIGTANAKVIAKAFDHDIERIRHASSEELSQIPGIGEVLAEGFVTFFGSEKNQQTLDSLLADLTFEAVETNAGEQTLDGKTFVITGAVYHFENRNELKEKIESLGGKVSGSVSAKTSFLINNDTASTSGKNKKAKELGIPVISEEEFLQMVGSI
ncbi:MAG: NAD-dependent DNA ligase LigA [Lachnospiraceae bacterium]|nr:NAD-dependent DNA ligase LigA [Lachnospiraceae bacterium]